MPIKGLNWIDVGLTLVGGILTVLVVWLCQGCVAERRVEGGLYVTPQGETMACVKALRSSCGWTWFGCGRNGETFQCMDKPQLFTEAKL